MILDQHFKLLDFSLMVHLKKC